MSVKLHLTLQELVIGPANEWAPRCEGWIIIRVADGAGYWLKPGAAGELNAGDGLVLGFDAKTQLRASSLGPMKLQFFTVYPQFLALLTVDEWHQFKTIAGGASPHFRAFRFDDGIGQKFTQLVEQPHGEGLAERCALLQFWADVVADLLVSRSNSSPGGNQLRWRFRQLFSQMPAIELSTCSLSELAQQLNCSLRHFNRLFREEFGVSFRVHQTEQRLLYARQLLLESDEPILNVAKQCGYKHLGFFRRAFKQRFGTAPGKWRSQTQRNLMDLP